MLLFLLTSSLFYTVYDTHLPLNIFSAVFLLKFHSGNISLSIAVQWNIVRLGLHFNDIFNIWSCLDPPASRSATSLSLWQVSINIKPRWAVCPGVSIMTRCDILRMHLSKWFLFHVQSIPRCCAQRCWDDVKMLRCWEIATLCVGLDCFLRNNSNRNNHTAAFWSGPGVDFLTLCLL